MEFKAQVSKQGKQLFIHVPMLYQDEFKHKTIVTVKRDKP